MPRIRALKPDFWSDSKMVKLSPYARLFYMGMWNFSLCERGHLPDDAEDLKLKILPADPVDGDDLLAELLKLGRIQRRQTPDGQTFLLMPKLTEHQKADPRWKPRCPYCLLNGTDTAAPETQEDSPTLTDTHPPRLPNSPELSPGREGKGREGKGVPPSAGALALVPSAAPSRPDTSQALVGEWIDHCRKRPPGTVIGQVGKQIKAMLGEGIDPGDIRAGLAEWWRKGVHPSVLPSIVNELMNAAPSRASPRRSTTDERVNTAIELAAKYAREDAG
jgi:hypothetical protein